MQTSWIELNEKSSSRKDGVIDVPGTVGWLQPGWLQPDGLQPDGLQPVFVFCPSALREGSIINTLCCDVFIRQSDVVAGQIGRGNLPTNPNNPATDQKKKTNLIS